MTDEDTLTDAKRELLMIEGVFGLTGGELNDSPCPLNDGDNVHRYWYDGAPEYAASDYRNDSRRLVTLVACELWGEVKVDQGWDRVASFTSSGEAACPWCGDGVEGDEENAEEEGEDLVECDLCEGDELVYLGDGWREIVFAKRPVLHAPEEYFEGVNVREPFAFEGGRYVLAVVTMPRHPTLYAHHFVIPEGETADEDVYSDDDGLTWAQERALSSAGLLQRLATHLNERLDLPYSNEVVLPGG
jgi:hypothetical protein